MTRDSHSFFREWLSSSLTKSLGGLGSGHYAHAGRPGLRGGSAPSRKKATISGENHPAADIRIVIGKSEHLPEDKRSSSKRQALAKTIRDMLFSINPAYLQGLRKITTDPLPGQGEWPRDIGGYYTQYADIHLNVAALSGEDEEEDIRQILLHEIGHHVTLRLGQKDPKDYAGLRDICYLDSKDTVFTQRKLDSFKKTVPLEKDAAEDYLIDFGLRPYSLTNRLEFAADVFAVMMLGDPLRKTNLAKMLGFDNLEGIFRVDVPLSGYGLPKVVKKYEPQIDDLGELVSSVLALGGPGSGFHGHAGRPGKRGGSAPRSDFANASDEKEFRDLVFRERRSKESKKSYEFEKNKHDFRVLLKLIDDSGGRDFHQQVADWGRYEGRLSPEREEMRRSLANWESKFHLDISRLLNGKIADDSQLTAYGSISEAERDISGLDAAFREAPSLPHGIIVRRGLMAASKAAATFLSAKPEDLVGKILLCKSFVSTTISKDVVRDFSRAGLLGTKTVTFNIKVPAGEKFIAVSSAESEILLDRNLQFEIEDFSITSGEYQEYNYTLKVVRGKIPDIELSEPAVFLGGPGSGYHGHAGRPSFQGGPAPRGVGFVEEREEQAPYSEKQPALSKPSVLDDFRDVLKASLLVRLRACKPNSRLARRLRKISTCLDAAEER